MLFIDCDFALLRHVVSIAVCVVCMYVCSKLTIPWWPGIRPKREQIYIGVRHDPTCHATSSWSSTETIADKKTPSSVSHCHCFENGCFTCFNSILAQWSLSPVLPNETPLFHSSRIPLTYACVLLWWAFRTDSSHNTHSCLVMFNFGSVGWNAM